jgi:hypothetical protein
MGRPSEIVLRFAVRNGEVDGVWLGGNTRLDSAAIVPSD